MKTKKIFYFDAKPGMVVGQDIYTSEGQLVANAGTLITDAVIASLSTHSIFEIVIAENDENTDAASTTAPAKVTAAKTENTSSYAERLRESKDFKKFEEGYLLNIAETKNMLNDVVNKNKEIVPEEFIKSSVELLSQSNTTFHIFDMLHNMRSYDDSTHTHSVNVGLIAALIGKWLRLSEDDVETLILCGMLHDIGKLTIPLDILTKPGRLTDEEYAVIKNHPLNGYNLLKGQLIDNRVKEACLFHHEKCDGSGYPFNLKGEKIPLFAKIITIADVYDAMTANRVYRLGMCPFEVIRIFEDEGLYHYDPRIIMTFLENIVQTYINNSVRLSDGTVGEIIMINKFALSKPVIKTATTCIDLSKTTDLKIEALI